MNKEAKIRRVRRHGAREIERFGSFDEEIERLTESHAEWVTSQEGGKPFYAIPWPAFDCEVLKKLLRPEFLDAEQKYSKLCWRFGFVGRFNGAAVSFGPLRQPYIDLSIFSDQEVATIGEYASSFHSVMDSARDDLDDYQERLLGVVGYYESEPTFQNELLHLRGLYERLPETVEFLWPLQRPIRLATTPAAGSLVQVSTPAQQDVIDFSRLLTVFFDKWGISLLRTWDLAEPQGPMIPNLLPPGAPAQPTHGVNAYVPSHFSLSANDLSPHKFRRFQKQDHERRHTPRELTSLQHYEQYAQMARVNHLDRVLKSRLPNGLPYGSKGRIDKLAKSYLNLTTTESVVRIRGWLDHCKLGLRNSIDHLKVVNN